jgi:hypothetical protein
MQPAAATGPEWRETYCAPGAWLKKFPNTLCSTLWRVCLYIILHLGVHQENSGSTQAQRMDRHLWHTCVMILAWFLPRAHQVEQKVVRTMKHILLTELSSVYIYIYGRSASNIKQIHFLRNKTILPKISWYCLKDNKLQDIINLKHIGIIIMRSKYIRMTPIPGGSKVFSRLNFICVYFMHKKMSFEVF